MRPRHALPLVTFSLVSAAPGVAQLRVRDEAISNTTAAITTTDVPIPTIPQYSPTSTLTTTVSNTYEKDHTEQTASGYEPDSTSATARPSVIIISGTPFVEIIQPSASGWESNGHWERPPASQSTPDSKYGEDDGMGVKTEQPGTNPTLAPGGNGGNTAIPQVTPGGPVDLLENIVSHITDAPQSGAQPTPPTVVVDSSVSLTLTPGLSTTVGATLVAIETVTAGKTVVVISPSGGAAVTTTITRPAPTTITTTGGPASRTSTAGAPLATSSPGAGASPLWKRMGSMEWLIGIIAGVGILF